MVIFFGALICAACLFLIVITVRDSNRFVTVHYRFGDPRIKKKLRLVLLADLHNKSYGKENEKLLSAIADVEPDLVLSAGDLMTSVPEKSMKTAERLVEHLAARYPFYYGNGNHEYRIYHEEEKYGGMGKEYRSVLEKCGVRLLENETVQLPVYGIRIAGLDLSREYYKKFKEDELPVSEIDKMLGACDQDWFTILIAHNPVFFENYAAWGADLTLSGHVHGGVMRLPFLGGVLSTSFRLFPKYDGGLFKTGRKAMVISRGLGSHTIPIRVFNPAELVVIDLEPEA